MRKQAEMLNNHLKHLEYLEDGLFHVFNEIKYVHIDLVETLNKNPNITLAEWVASYKAKSPIEAGFKSPIETSAKLLEEIFLQQLLNHS